MIKQPHKAVILLGFGSAKEPDSRDGFALAPSIMDSAVVQRAVKEALAAGLKELIFVTADSTTPVEDQFGGFHGARAERVIFARQFAARSVGEAICGIRHLLSEEPFVLLLPTEVGRRGGEETTKALLAAYRNGGGNVVAVGDEAVLKRDGSFAAAATDAAGRYLLQPAVLDYLEERPLGTLADALLAIAEAWPLTALPTPPAPRRAPSRVSSSDAPTVRGRRPVDVVASLDAGD